MSHLLARTRLLFNYGSARTLSMRCTTFQTRRAGTGPSQARPLLAAAVGGPAAAAVRLPFARPPRRFPSAVRASSSTAETADGE